MKEKSKLFQMFFLLHSHFQAQILLFLLFNPNESPYVFATVQTHTHTHIHLLTDIDTLMYIYIYLNLDTLSRWCIFYLLNVFGRFFTLWNRSIFNLTSIFIPYFWYFVLMLCAILINDFRFIIWRWKTHTQLNKQKKGRR